MSFQEQTNIGIIEQFKTLQKKKEDIYEDNEVEDEYLKEILQFVSENSEVIKNILVPIEKWVANF
ncbi:hypothetical protein [Flammeovirga sp. SJP92]|uniref:hypothetical protein n=1 Tax=Flammeovirga sp. SJP92 TaxID=1775430 RepID=UPI000788B707|nr:hypothetical protein [Flammeovirga sp. SJP92]KXX69281.1 hypothetical protein AVL50_19885 [Flammeovirga sp. SJP92]